MVESIEDQIRALKVKAIKYDELKAAVEGHLKDIQMANQTIEEAKKALQSLFGIGYISSGAKKDFSSQIKEIHKDFLNGSKIRLGLEQFSNYLGIENGNAAYWFNKLCRLDGMEKIREGKKCYAIFKVNK